MCDLPFFFLMEQLHEKPLIESLASRYVVFDGFSALPPSLSLLPLNPVVRLLHAIPSSLPAQLLC